jgi:hypothetical protein
LPDQAGLARWLMDEIVLLQRLQLDADRQKRPRSSGSRSDGLETWNAPLQ